MDVYFGSKDFNIVSIENLKNMTREYAENFKYKVYMSRNKHNDRLMTAVAATDSVKANSYIDNAKWQTITEDFFTGQYADKEGVIKEGQMSDASYRKLMVNK